MQEKITQIFTEAIKNIKNDEGKSSPDMFVNDIYGPDCSSIHLPGNTIFIQVIYWRVAQEHWENVLTRRKFHHSHLNLL